MPPTEITDDPDWTEGNFEITSSDGVRFKVRDYHIFSASPVFAASHAEAASTSKKSIEFTDDVIETAEVVCLFLRLATTYRPDLDVPVRALVAFYRFLRKWDCAALESLLTNAIGISRHHDEGMKPLQVFHLGALLDDPTLRKLAFSKPAPPKLQVDEMYNEIDPNEWSLTFWRTSGLSADHIYAMVRLYHRSPRMKSGGTGRWHADEFECLLADARAAQE